MMKSSRVEKVVANNRVYSAHVRASIIARIIWCLVFGIEAWYNVLNVSLV